MRGQRDPHDDPAPEQPRPRGAVPVPTLGQLGVSSGGTEGDRGVGRIEMTRPKRCAPSALVRLVQVKYRLRWRRRGVVLTFEE